jgi:osmotically-inducible protein OsmY
MLRRVTVALVLVAAVGLAVYAWRGRAGAAPAPAPTGQKLAGRARALGEEAREKLSEIGHELHDARVTASVRTALALNRGLRSYSIDVSSENGVVTLGGRVDGEDDRARAEALAAAVPEVTRVVNQIQVAAGPAPAPGRTLGETLEDQTVEARVRLALSLNRELRGTDITVQAYRRQVTLGGEVGTDAQREEALQTARDTVSVAGVVDRIQVRAVAARAGASSAERAAAAQRAVNANPHLTAFRLQVHEEGDRLVLRGSVSTPVEKDLAIVLAREAAGAAVDDAVEVRAGA